MEYEKARTERIKQNEARLKELGLPLMKSSLNGTIRISKNKKRKDKNTNLENDAEYMASTGNKKSRSDPIDSLSSHEIETISVLSPTNQVINVGQSKGPEIEIVDDTTHETEKEVGEGVTRPTRGITCGKGARNAMKASKKKLPLEFNFEMLRVICQNDSSFMHECGYIVRNNCSLQYKDWRLVPNADRTTLRHKLNTIYDIDVENSNVRKIIDSYMSRAWRGHRATLHAYFKEIGGEADPTKAKTTPHPDVKKEDWEYLCDMWSDEKYLEIAKKRVIARAKRKVGSRNGSKSTVRYHIERGLDLESSSGQLETWRLTHWDEEKGWISNDAATIYDEMMKLRNQHTVESMSDKKIIESVLGRSSNRLHGWGRDPVIADNTMCTKKSKRLTYDELVDQLQTVTTKCAIMEQALIDNNIMPPPSSTLEQSQSDTLESDESIDD